MNEHLNWYESTTNGDSGRTAANRAGVSVATLNRQVQRGEFTAEMVIAIARAYHVPPTSALVATGYLEHSEVSGGSAATASQLLNDQELIREVARRINVDPSAWFGTFGEMADEPAEKTTPQGDGDSWKSAYRLAARRSHKPSGDPKSK